MSPRYVRRQRGGGGALLLLIAAAALVVAVLAIFSRAVLLLPIMGACFVASSVSDILQVGSFKTEKKRIFKMTPLHLHYEK